MAKYWLTDLQNKIVDRCLQLFGGYGYMDEYPISRMYRDARVQRIYAGTNEIMKLLIARSCKSHLSVQDPGSRASRVGRDDKKSRRNKMTDAFIYDAVRTPRGKGKSDGSLHEVTR
jgi:hypothetical protein